MWHLATNLLDEIPLGVEGLEPIQRAVGSVEHGEFDLVSIPLAFMKIGKPVSSPQLDKIIERGAFLEVYHRGANSRSSPVEIGLGPAQHASSLFKLFLVDLNPRLDSASQASLLLKSSLEDGLL